ncbi:hypothetical protein AwDysgo_15620 [Bacteroidales bacterium]|nr:hypothetical protein AwDysgo_15620 [Bacteroidales bacterium]
MKTESIKIEPHWVLSKEFIWESQFAQLQDSANSRFCTKKILQIASAVAATLLLALLIPAFYTNTIDVAFGEHKSIELPDGSKVDINAGSSLSYKPLLWKVSRKVQLEGEAYFEVAKGSAFTVNSKAASVLVLGTSFNVYARESFRATCFSGQVEVFNLAQSVILSPNMQASFDGAQLESHNISTALQTIGWKSKQFSFDAVPLSSVIAEIERQYNIKVLIPKKIDYLYTGNFTKLDDPKQVLEILGKPFGIILKIE